MSPSEESDPQRRSATSSLCGRHSPRRSSFCFPESPCHYSDAPWDLPPGIYRHTATRRRPFETIHTRGDIPGPLQLPAMLVQAFLVVVGTFLAYFVVHGLQILYNNLTSPLRRILNGPPIPNYFLGNFKEVGDYPGLTAKWERIYGQTYILHGMLCVNELITSDLKALNHIIAYPAVYERGRNFQDVARRLFGEGILSAVLDQHKRQRRVLNPAFGTAQVKRLAEVFIERALRDTWNSEIRKQDNTGASGTIEVFAGLRKMTLNVIGQAGFGYEFDALNPHGRSSELNDAFAELFHSPNAKFYAGVWLLQSMVPILRLLPLPGGSATSAARGRMEAIGRRIVEQSKAQLAKPGADGVKTGSGTARRDLLSLLLKANMSADLPKSQKLSEEEVLGQIPAFFVAGHETTSTATAWAMHALSLHPSVQQTLREELLSLGTDNPTMDELNALPYLEKVVREVMRRHSPVVWIQRTAFANDVLPLSKPIVGRDGKEYYGEILVLIRKGQLIRMPIAEVNTSEDVWGPDALEFRPDRWDNVPDAASAVPGVWANQFTFLAGAHNCIGFRFALAELKAILFTLVCAFEITPALPKERTGPIRSGQIQEPSVIGAKYGTGYPLVLTPLWVS
ncbi:hypothetical protein HMN09_00784500 [Mycena chlorophos]|uniref:Cytochrome P450 n=1 Tax=Mycena chlorophos TaxID=658473 RepID=A0A8H6W571_MYCCL|nr:hypothetical protein HMN09_00784500 [Mycena chlorophos]